MANVSKIKYTLVFNRKGELNQDGEALIQIRAYQNGKSRYFSTGIYVEPRHWDERNKCVKNTHPNEFLFNSRVGEQLQDMKAFENQMLNRNGRFSVDRLHEYDQKDSEISVESFTAFFEDELLSHIMKPISKKGYQDTFNKLKTFRKTIYFEDLNFKLINEFNQFLHRQKLNPNTIKKHHMRVHTFILQAIKQDLLKVDDDPYKKFEFKSIEPKRVSLTEEEFRKIECLAFGPDQLHLQRIRDIFLFQTYIGARYKDLVNLTSENFTETSKGLVLKYVASKTGKSATLPLYLLFCRSEGEGSRTEMIARQFLQIVAPLGELGKDIPLFEISDQYYNRVLKTLAKMAGINKKLSSHAARRTCASLLHKLGMPQKMIQQLLQHQSPMMTNIYIQHSQGEFENELSKLRWN